MKTQTLTLDKIRDKQSPPKPTKSQILLATATLIYNKTNEEYKKLQEQHANLYKLLEASIDTSKQEQIESFKSYWMSSRNGPYVEVKTSYKLTPEQIELKKQIDILFEKCRTIERRNHIDFIVYDLKQRQVKSTDDVVKALVNDATISKQLLKIGEQILSQPSKNDIKHAINT